MAFLRSVYNHIKANRGIWISRLVVFAVIAGMSFIPGLGINAVERTYDPGIMDILPFDYTFWIFNRFLWFPLPQYFGFDGYPTYESGSLSPFVGLTVLWWAFLSFVIVAAGNYLLKRFFFKKR